MKKFLNIVFAGVFTLMVAAPIAAVATPTPVAAAAQCEANLLGIPPWYRGMTNDDCSIKNPNELGGLSAFIWRIVLNVIQIGLVLIAYIAGFFILYGGFLFMTGGGNPSQVEKGRKSIFNAVIGLVISLSAIAITNFIFEIVGSAPSADGEVVQLTGEQILGNALNLVYFLAGTIAVVMIIFSGLSYITSSGDSGKLTKAKGTLTYAVVGLIIVLVAFAITSFVIGRFS